MVIDKVTASTSQRTWRTKLVENKWKMRLPFYTAAVVCLTESVLGHIDLMSKIPGYFSFMVHDQYSALTLFASLAVSLLTMGRKASIADAAHNPTPPPPPEKRDASAPSFRTPLPVGGLLGGAGPHAVAPKTEDTTILSAILESEETETLAAATLYLKTVERGASAKQAIIIKAPMPNIDRFIKALEGEGPVKKALTHAKRSGEFQVLRDLFEKILLETEKRKQAGAPIPPLLEPYALAALQEVKDILLPEDERKTRVPAAPEPPIRKYVTTPKLDDLLDHADNDDLREDLDEAKRTAAGSGDYSPLISLLQSKLGDASLSAGDRARVTAAIDELVGIL